MQVEIYHAAFGEERSKKIATLTLDDATPDMEALERAFLLTNTIEEPWHDSESPELVLHRENWRNPSGCRSTSMGDFADVVRNGVRTKYACALFGWDKVDG